MNFEVQSYDSHDSFSHPTPSLPSNKRISIFLPNSIKRTSLSIYQTSAVPKFPAPKSSKTFTNIIGPKKSLKFNYNRSDSYSDNKRSSNESLKMSNSYAMYNNPLSSGSRIMDSRSHIYSEAGEKTELEIRFKDLEERNLLYQHLQQLLKKDDQEDIMKFRILMQEGLENLDYYMVDIEEQFQKVSDFFTKLQEDQQFLYCERKTVFQLIKNYADPYPLLDLRKFLVYYQRKISDYSEKIIKHPAFDNIVLLIIIWNCVLLAIEDPSKSLTDTQARIEQMLLVCYTIEMALKIAGLGLIWKKKSYLRDGWNVLDFIIVVTSYLPYLNTNESDTASFKFSSLRILRVLRPLRTISSIKSLRNLILTLFSSVPLLLDILMFLFFFFMTYAMIGNHLFSGALLHRCFYEQTGIIQDPNGICGYRICPSGYFCGKGLNNPFSGIRNFDNILFSLVMGFQVVTLQAWTTIMIEVVHSSSVFTIIYFISLVCFGSFFLLSLTLAVIKSKFTNTQKLKESLSKEVVKKISEIQINELLLFKKMERSHFKRMKNQKNNFGIGASEEGRVGNNRLLNEITWDDLLQLKEMIREEKLRADEEEQFQEMRRGRIKSDDNIIKLEEEKLLRYMQRVQNMKKKALRLFLKKLPSVKEISQTKKKDNLVFPKKNGIINVKNCKVFPIKNHLVFSKHYNQISPIAEEDSERFSFNSKQTLSPNSHKHATSKISRQSFKIILEDPSYQTSPLNNPSFTQTSSPEPKKDLINNIATTSLQSFDIIEDPTMFLGDNLTPILHKSLSPSFKDLKTKQKQSQALLFLKKRHSLSNFPQRNSFMFSPEPNVHPITEEAENEEGDPENELQKKRSTIKKGSFSFNSKDNHNKIHPFPTFPPNNDFLKKETESYFEKDLKTQKNLQSEEYEDSDEEEISKEEKPSFETDLMHDSDFNDSITLNKAKIEAILNAQASPTSQVNNFLPIEELEEGFETKNSDRAFLKETESNKDVIQLPESNRGSKQRIGTMTYSINKVSSFKKITSVKKMNLALKITNKTVLTTDTPTATNRPKYNIRDFNLLVDNEKLYISYSSDDVLENRILALAEEKKSKELQLIQKESYKIDLKNSSFKQFEHSIIEQIKEKRRSYKENQWKKRKRFKIALKNQLSFKDLQINLPMISLKQDFFRQKTFHKKSAQKKTLTLGLKKRKLTIGMKLDDDLEVSYKSLQKKINEDMLTENKNKIDEAILDEKDFLTIHEEDRRFKKKSIKVWSGSDVLPLKLFDGVWSLRHLNNFFKSLSFAKQDRLIWIPTFSGKLKIAHKTIKLFLLGPIFEKLLFLIILFNTAILSSEGIFKDQHTLNIIFKFFLFFDIFFVVEMLLKLLILGLITYFRDPMNIFDSFTAVMSFLELIMEGKSSISFMKVFRVLRVTRLLRSIGFMRMLVKIITRALKNFIYIALLLFLFLFVYTLLGMQIFFDFRSVENLFREDFSSFSKAFITTFQILTATAWQNVLHMAYVSAVNNFVAVLYIISWIFIGNYVFLNLFLAIILDEFTKDENYIIQDEEFSQEHLNEVFQKDFSIKTASTSATQFKGSSNASTESAFEKNNEKKEKLFINIKCENSMWLFSKNNRIRILCFKLSTSQKMENLWLLIIFLSEVKIIIDTYFPINPPEILSKLDYVSFGFFTIELVIKIISAGFFLEKGSYLRNPWNKLDFIIIVFYFFDIVIKTLNVSAATGFRVIRMLMIPLRLISHNNNMKIVVTALLDSITSIFNTLIVIVLIWLMFAILGVSLLKEKMGFCDVEDHYEIGRNECLGMEKKWKIWDTNFDNIYNAMITLFIISSKEVWNEIMYRCIDAADESEGPRKDHYLMIPAFFIIFLLIGAYFLLNLLVGVIFYNFNKAKRNEQKQSSLFLTDEQTKWFNIQKMIAEVKPDFLALRKPKNPFRLKVFLLVTHHNYEKFLMFMIVINTVILAIHLETAPKSYISLLNNFELGFQSFYIVEAIIKIFGLGFKAYWYNSWNRFDFFLTIFSFIDVVLWTEELTALISNFQSIIKIMRILRFLRLLKFFKGPLKLLETLLFTLPPLINVGALLVLIIFIYAVLGVFMFSNITHGDIIDDFDNFTNLGFAMWTMFKVLSGDEWYFIMFDLYHKKDGCELTKTCGSVFALFYFISFYLICTYIMLNLFILIIIQQFEEFHLKEDNPITHFKRNLDSFSKIWAEFAEASLGITIPSKKLIDFYMRLEPPLGFGPKSERPKVALEIMKMNLTGDEQGNIYFNELMFASMKRIFGQEILTNVSKEIQEMMETQERQIKARLERKTLKMINSFYATDSPATFNRRLAISKKNSHIKPKKQIVNPMITILFVGMTFKSWKRYMEHSIKGEIDLTGSVIRPQKPDSEEEDSSYYSDDYDNNFEDDNHKKEDYSINENSFRNPDLPIKGEEKSIQNSNSKDSEEEASKEEDSKEEDSKEEDSKEEDSEEEDSEEEDSEEEFSKKDQKEEENEEEEEEEEKEEEEAENEKEEENQEEEENKINKRNRNKGEIALTMIGKFINKRKKVVEEKKEGEEKEEGGRKEQRSESKNMFRTFFMAKAPRNRLQNP